MWAAGAACDQLRWIGQPNLPSLVELAAISAVIQRVPLDDEMRRHHVH